MTSMHCACANQSSQQVYEVGEVGENEVCRSDVVVMPVVQQNDQ